MTNIDPQLVKLQELVAELVTDSILYNEEMFWNIILKESVISGDYQLVDQILCTDNQKINNIIAMTSENLYNHLHREISNGVTNPTIDKISEISKIANYHINEALSRMFKLTLQIHGEIDRSSLRTNNFETYRQSLIDEINEILPESNIIQFFTRFETNYTGEEVSNPFSVNLQ